MIRSLPKFGGEYSLLSRALTRDGMIQPTTHNGLNGGYRINFARPRMITTLDDEPFTDEDFVEEPMTRDMDAFAERTPTLTLDVDMDMLLIDGAGI